MLEQQPRSLKKLSEEAGLGQSTIGRLARGDTEPTLSEMAALVAVFDLRSIEELVAPIGTRVLLDEALVPTEERGTA